jgi:hypothetical protein
MDIAALSKIAALSNKNKIRLDKLCLTADNCGITRRAMAELWHMTGQGRPARH